MTQAQPPRLESVNQVRAHQREWLDATRREVADGGHFAICNGDEFEEVFIAMGIPVVAINYWNYLVVAQQKKQYYFDVLNKRGYPGDNFFALGLASSMEPTQAPWGGLPKPTLICGSLRYEMELRVTELWAREYGCPIIPMDFAFPTSALQEYPDNWYDLIRNDWESLVDPHRLEFRMMQERRAITYVEQLTGKTFSVAELERSMTLLNEQMDYWARARELLGGAHPCPVTMRDQMSMYQAMWHRGTEAGVKLVRNYCEEVEHRVKQGIGGYRNEKIRFYYGDQVPAFQDWAEETYGAVAVAGSYSGFPDAYARNIHNHDPMRALAARHLLLVLYDHNWILKQAKEHRCDAFIMIEPHTTPEYPSIEQQTAEAAGIPYLAIPRDADDPEIRAMVSKFIEERLL
ncbi:MAG: 2-hydroxyacyl-CoA dehydratase [Sphingomonadales bacterium]|nr:MAG: 2-hydroxyacyl-CoA dehydratase [Sphingomonadales bacterium]